MNGGTWRTFRWLQAHRTLAALLTRVPPVRDYISRLVWREAEADPAFVAGIERGRADFAAGRTVRYEVRDGELVPVRGPIVKTAKGWTKRRYPSLSFTPHAYIGNGPKGGGGCIDCGWPCGHELHRGSA